MSGMYEKHAPVIHRDSLSASELLLVQELDVLANSTSLQVLRKESGSIVNTSLSEFLALTNLSDVVISSPTSGQVLTYNGSSWVNSDATGGGTVGPGTTNEIAYFNAPTTIASLTTATYPSLTELSYVKGVTSAIQTQLNAKADLTLSNITSLDASAETIIEGAIDTLANLISIQGRTVTLADAGANALFGWDDTAGAYENLTQAEARTVLGLGTAAYVATDLADLNEATIESAIDTLANLTAASALATVGTVTSGVWSSSITSATVTNALTLAENASIALDPAGSADGKYSGITVTGTGGAVIAFGDVVTLDKDDSRWELVDISVAAAATGDARGVIGIAVTSSSDGGALTVLLHGIIRADANFPALTIGAAVYASTTGDVVVAQPTTTDHVIRIVGSALTADEIYFNPENDWITHT